MSLVLSRGGISLTEGRMSHPLSHLTVEPASHQSNAAFTSITNCWEALTNQWHNGSHCHDSGHIELGTARRGRKQPVPGSISFIFCAYLYSAVEEAAVLARLVQQSFGGGQRQHAARLVRLAQIARPPEEPDPCHWILESAFRQVERSDGAAIRPL